MPGRKSFKYMPQEKKVFKKKEALKLRSTFKTLMPVHGLLLLTDFYIYEFEISAIVFDLIFLWMSFYNYMTLNKIIVGI